jgi:hypothetical protein
MNVIVMAIRAGILSPNDIATNAARAVGLAVGLACCSGKISSIDAGSMPSSIDAGSMPPPSCAALCSRSLQAGCHVFSHQSGGDDCEKQCKGAEVTAQMGSCGSAFDAMLSCLEMETIQCPSNGQIDPSTCATQIAALNQCQNPRPAGCEGIPYPPGGSTTCSSPGGPSGQPIAETCSDVAGHTWTATCTGSNCSCSYDGKAFCSCQGDGGRGCCPGTF